MSVIIPFFNEAAFLRSAIRSVQAQRLDDVEILVVNDNPEVFSPKALSRLVDGLPVKLLHHPRNLGTSSAHNSALDVATGRWIGFLDADDYYTSNGLARHLAYAQETDADITHAQAYRTIGNGPGVRILPRDALLFEQRGLKGPLIEAETSQFFVSSWSSLYKKSFLDEHALHFDPEQTISEDRLFVLETVCRASSIALFAEPVRIWWQRVGSMSTRKNDFGTHLQKTQLIEKKPWRHSPRGQSRASSQHI